MAFIKEENEDMKMAFIKEESEDMKIEETFIEKHEYTEEQTESSLESQQELEFSLDSQRGQECALDDSQWLVRWFPPRSPQWLARCLSIVDKHPLNIVLEALPRPISMQRPEHACLEKHTEAGVIIENERNQIHIPLCVGLERQIPLREKENLRCC
ncbi:hypothetical protein DPX16_18038 [Anabarilius grahami]|uniref:Uncharacterized protein n=1 Tax=Anabarilius grahami TaxID=495550 RepID=A0A3N0XT55_ANAGA|nr:hypothetical protein DPX16_18038 [Anabarilius grahami]